MRCRRRRVSDGERGRSSSPASAGGPAAPSGSQPRGHAATPARAGSARLVFARLFLFNLLMSSSFALFPFPFRPQSLHHTPPRSHAFHPRVWHPDDRGAGDPSGQAELREELWRCALSRSGGGVVARSPASSSVLRLVTSCSESRAINDASPRRSWPKQRAPSPSSRRAAYNRHGERSRHRLLQINPSGAAR
ncbi:hypothetical protein AOLI_G00079400 [Acnodon oligacanthus]